MNNVFVTIAAAVAFAAIHSPAMAQQSPKAAIGAAMIEEDRQVKIAVVRPGGTGHLMGIRPGDVIVQAGRWRIQSISKLTGYIRTLKVGDSVELTVKRKGENVQLKGTAQARQP